MDVLIYVGKIIKVSPDSGYLDLRYIALTQYHMNRPIINFNSFSDGTK
jgi:hypothetical protein